MSAGNPFIFGSNAKVTSHKNVAGVVLCTGWLLIVTGIALYRHVEIATIFKLWFLLVRNVNITFDCLV